MLLPLRVQQELDAVDTPLIVLHCILAGTATSAAPAALLVVALLVVALLVVVLLAAAVLTVAELAVAELVHDAAAVEQSAAELVAVRELVVGVEPAGA